MKVKTTATILIFLFLLTTIYIVGFIVDKPTCNIPYSAGLGTTTKICDIWSILGENIFVLFNGVGIILIVCFIVISLLLLYLLATLIVNKIAEKIK